MTRTHSHTHTTRTFTSLLTDYGLWSRGRALAGPSVPAEISTAGAYQCTRTHTNTHSCSMPQFWHSDSLFIPHTDAGHY